MKYTAEFKITNKITTKTKKATFATNELDWKKSFVPLTALLLPHPLLFVLFPDKNPDIYN